MGVFKSLKARRFQGVVLISVKLLKEVRHKRKAEGNFSSSENFTRFRSNLFVKFKDNFD